MAISLKSVDDIKHLRAANKLVAQTLDYTK